MEKFKFDVPSDNSETPVTPVRRWFDVVSSYLLLFIQLLCSQTSIMPFSAVQRVFIVEHYFRKQMYEAFKQIYQVHFPDDAVSNKSIIF
jgi:hypothetical protein